VVVVRSTPGCNEKNCQVNDGAVNNADKLQLQLHFFIQLIKRYSSHVTPVA
jgi:hypothetical protein